MTTVYSGEHLERRGYLDQVVHDHTVRAIGRIARHADVNSEALRQLGFRKERTRNYTEENFYQIIKYLEEVVPGSNMQVALNVYDAMSHVPEQASGATQDIVPEIANKSRS